MPGNQDTFIILASSSFRDSLEKTGRLASAHDAYSETFSYQHDGIDRDGDFGGGHARRNRQPSTGGGSGTGPKVFRFDGAKLVYEAAMPRRAAVILVPDDAFEALRRQYFPH